MLEIGSLVDGKYKILNKVGQGGMSVVYLAVNEKANKLWAVKEICKDKNPNVDVIKQGAIEQIDLLKRLNHSGIPSVIDVVDTEDAVVIVMDYVRGRSLHQFLKDSGAQPPARVIAWAKQLCDILHYLHTKEPAVIYRDVKPANIIITELGKVMLLDFGCARTYKKGALADTACLGTVGYAAPEQFGGMGQTDPRTDIYGLGVTMHQLLTGADPCEPPYLLRPIRKINPKLSRKLEKIVIKCTQADPQSRYQTVDQVLFDLNKLTLWSDLKSLFAKMKK